MSVVDRYRCSNRLFVSNFDFELFSSHTVNIERLWRNVNAMAHFKYAVIMAYRFFVCSQSLLATLLFEVVVFLLLEPLGGDFGLPT